MILENENFSKFLRSITTHLRKYLKLEKKFLFDYFRKFMNYDELRNMATMYLRMRNINMVDVTNFLLKLKSTKHFPIHETNIEIFH